MERKTHGTSDGKDATLVSKLLVGEMPQNIDDALKDAGLSRLPN